MNEKHKLRNSRHKRGIEEMVRSRTYLLLRLEDLRSVSSICIENPTAASAIVHALENPTAACAHSPCPGEQLFSQPVSPNQQAPGSVGDCLKDKRRTKEGHPTLTSDLHTQAHMHIGIHQRAHIKTNCLKSLQRLQIAVLHA